MSSNPKKLNKSTYTAALCVLGVMLAAALVFYYLPDFRFLSDATADGLIKELIVRLIASLLMIFFIATSDDAGLLKPVFRALPKKLAICLPCFAVAIVNFPFSALATGKATVERTDLIALLIVDCFAIAFFEELFFRGMLQRFIAHKFADKKANIFLTVVVTSVLFGLFHLINLASGAGVYGTLLQVVYTFLIGAMLSFMMLSTGDIWLCVLAHAVFDFGGAVVDKLGGGYIHDAIFWILTVAVGLLCGVYVIFGLIKMQKAQDKRID